MALPRVGQAPAAAPIIPAQALPIHVPVAIPVAIVAIQNLNIAQGMANFQVEVPAVQLPTGGQNPQPLSENAAARIRQVLQQTPS